ncbi:MAG TPA: hypothetical protein VFQ61_26485 [Polyangiaceae bacterium]|nr:hypothetical protein [Polyangiaceae bacterium]
MKVFRKSLLARDQGVTEFSAILLRLCDASGALAAALVDSEGETVDYAGRVEPFDVRVAAAECRLLLGGLHENASRLWPAPNSFIIRSGKHSISVHALSEGYAVVLVLPRHSFDVSARALSEASREIAREAGLTVDVPRGSLLWSRVEVRCVSRKTRRPAAIWQNGAFRPVLVLGRLERPIIGGRDRGYLIRLDTGAELLLVREPLGRWFAAAPL